MALITRLTPGNGELFAAETHVFDSGLTYVPLELCTALGIEPGDHLVWTLTEDGAILCRHKPDPNAR